MKDEVESGWGLLEASDLVERAVPIAMSTLVTFIDRSADLVRGIDGLHWKRLLASAGMATGGTGLKVIVTISHASYGRVSCGASAGQWPAKRG